MSIKAGFYPQQNRELKIRISMLILKGLFITIKF